MNPLVSVIIPTAGRPHLLPRAVTSALAGLPPGASEVIVVPNGPDSSWQQSLSAFNGNSALKVLPLPEANANIARNRGLREATGKYVRFLDDDDFLYPDACRSQYELLERSDADICSGGVDYLDRHGRVYWRTLQPETGDFVAAILSPLRRALPVMHVFRRSNLTGLAWRESQPFLQDVQWLLDICQRTEPTWVKVGQPVGTWLHHPGHRISADLPIDAKQREVARMLSETVDGLGAAGRLTPDRRQAAAAGLWKCIHAAYPYRPRFWAGVARDVLRTYPDARPNIGFYRMPAARGIDPVLVETVMLPKRWLNIVFRGLTSRPRTPDES